MDTTIKWYINLSAIAIAIAICFRNHYVFSFCFLLGIVETVSLLVSGWIANQKWTKTYHYHKTYLILCGLTNLLCPLATTFPLLMSYSVTFAIFSGGYLALMIPVLESLHQSSL
uniref:Uncharacterized protein n=1 Tax=Micrurus lemniscatus lemniscatus TaxID=129467 RepID=A0A2D4JCL5_MICLE